MVKVKKKDKGLPCCGYCVHRNTCKKQCKERMACMSGCKPKINCKLKCKDFILDIHKPRLLSHWGTVTQR